MQYNVTILIICGIVHEMNEIMKEIENIKIIPVVTVENVTQGLYIMEALTEGGLPAAEITFRTEAAAEAIRVMCREYPNALIGAGTVLNIRQAREAEDAGAKFIVSPGYSDEVVNYCIEENTTVLPGCMTPTDIQRALAAGLSMVKFFPAEPAGGLKLLKALSEPFPKLRFMPTGGISKDNLIEYLNFPKVIACGGSWITKAAKENDFAAVKQEAENAVKLVCRWKEQG